MTDGWRVGSACLVRGDRPGYVEAVSGERATVRYLAGGGPPGLGDVATLRTSALVRPPGHRHLDRRGTRSWTTKPPWRGDDLIRLRDGWPTVPVAALAAEVGRSVDACVIAMHRWWGVRRSDPREVLSMRAVARILAVDDHRVRALIRWRYLRGARSGIRAGPNRRWRIADADLCRFLERHPAQYDRRRITSPAHRALAEEVFARDPLLTILEVADRVGLVPAIVLTHVAAGHIRAVFSRGGAAGSNRRWLVPASALEGFQVAVPSQVWAAHAAAAVHERGLWTAVEAAARRGVHRSHVLKLVRRGTLAGEPVRIGRRVMIGVRPWPVDRSEPQGDAAG